MSKISQREAQRLKKRVAELEGDLRKQRMNWSSDWPGGIHIGTTQGEATNAAKIQIARRLGHAVVVTDTSDGKLEFRALPLPERL